MDTTTEWIEPMWNRRTAGMTTATIAVMAGACGCSGPTTNDVAYCVDAHDVRVSDESCVGQDAEVRWVFKAVAISEKVPALGDRVDHYRGRANGSAGYGAPETGGSLLGVDLHRLRRT